MGQVADYNGVFAYDPNIGDLKITHFYCGVHSMRQKDACGANAVT